MKPPKLLKTAIVKLCAVDQYEPTQEYQALAVSGARFCIDICFGHLESNQFNTKAVASHMRILESITPDRSWQSTGYPSEPLLACAAARCLHDSEDSLCQTLKQLCNKILNEMVDTGDKGELISRLLLLIGKDLYCRSLATWPKGPISNILTAENELSDCVPVSVVGYLEFMFGDVVPLKAKTQLQGWCLNFTHWIPMASHIRNIKQPLLA